MFYSVFFSVFLFFIATTSLKADVAQPASGGWAATYGGGGEDWATSIRQTCDGGYIVAGRTASFGAGKGDLWLLKLGSDKTVEWQKTYGGVNKDRAESIQQTSEGGYVVAGWTGSFGAGEDDAWVLKLGFDGTVEWQKTYGGIDIDVAHSIQETRDRGYIVTGCTSSFGAGEDDLWVLKLKPNGSIHPSCDFVGDTILLEIGSNATILDTKASIKNSYANPQDSSATVLDTNVSAEILCPTTPYSYSTPL